MKPETVVMRAEYGDPNNPEIETWEFQELLPEIQTLIQNAEKERERWEKLKSSKLLFVHPQAQCDDVSATEILELMAELEKV